MSTKIFEAYRLRRCDLTPFISDVVHKGEERARAVLRAFYETLIKAVDVESEPFKESLEIWKDERQARIDVAHRAFEKGYAKAIGSFERSPFNVDVTVTLRARGRWFYVIPYADWLMKDVLDFLRDDPRLEEYAYWNNVDPPKTVAPEAWRGRAKVWRELTDHDRWQEYMAIEVVNFEKLSRVSPFLDLLSESIAAESQL